ncbi:response regulator transcription factor [Paenibacillus radicis (ex Xue et al. 2023)]|uniref:Response regulator transcription factor n=1 Tax=Paenibacillus radicis (ex Xue et al. 2023) TaxID=2972489 RepID=A0ABT1YUL4_9BACL|nr:response regulator transcription factor [Paenibacillus radicis (ex Xue et al. 2023)]MCR8636710.1 response regulator transcription factor [Paenibacillus radicis (ex Xue et al. 2023)]
MGATVLTVDDDIQLQEMLHLFLSAEGFRVVQAFDGEQCLALIQSKQPDLVLLDIQLPDMNGITLCRSIRSIYPLPILFLTGNKEQANKLDSLQAGGDDYITKPFDQLELSARVRSHMRWGKILASTEQTMSRKLTFSGLELDLERKTVIANGAPITLLAKELHLLITLAKNPHRVYHPRQLYELIWDDSSRYSSDLIKVYIHQLRKKLEIDPANPRYIQTVRGFGYKFDGTEGKLP